MTSYDSQKPIADNELATICPWEFEPRNTTVECNYSTSIDVVADLMDLVAENGTLTCVADKFSNMQVARYPKPNKCIHDDKG